jgi:hypothetical protein
METTLMARYRANPVEVEAFIIAAVGARNENGSRMLLLDNGDSVVATKEMLARIDVQMGDYYVTQLADGYIYLNPREVFERKYSLAEV